MSLFHLFLSLNTIPLNGYTVDQWTSQVWTTWVHLQMNFKYSWPFVSVGVASMESTNCRNCTVFMIHSQLTQLVWYPQIRRTYGTWASMDFSIQGKSTNQFLRDTEGQLNYLLFIHPLIDWYLCWQNMNCYEHSVAISHVKYPQQFYLMSYSKTIEGVH